MSRFELKRLHNRLKAAEVAAGCFLDIQLARRLNLLASRIRTGSCIPGAHEEAIREGKDLLKTYFS